MNIALASARSCLHRTGSALLVIAIVAMTLPSAELRAQRRLVITVDDLPGVSTSRTLETLQDINRGMVAAFQEHSVPAIGFVNEKKLSSPGGTDPDPAKVALLELWLEAGLELGNHSYSHPDINRTPLSEFQQDVLRGERVTKPLAAENGLPYRFFRHPFLHAGTDLETKHTFEAFLTENNYRVAPVTIDNSEWIFARAYDKLLDSNDISGAERTAQAYLDYMIEKTAYYEQQSLALFDREIPQVLLIHANRLNGRVAGLLIERFRSRGYTFIDLDRALRDPAYASDDRYAGTGGISWLHRWALTRGVERSFFAGEPATPKWVLEAAGIDSE